MPPIPESPASLAPPQATSNSPTEDYIPIIHKRVPTKIQTQGLAPPGANQWDPDDDGFTPITPAPGAGVSPKSPRRWFPTSPRDALGIPVSKYFLGRKLSKNGHAEDMEPLSPREAPSSYPPGAGGGAEGKENENGLGLVGSGALGARIESEEEVMFLCCCNE
ncbi:hypothetical protein PG989_002780 [Apiospora arundinis]